MFSTAPKRFARQALLASVSTIACGLALWSFKFGEPFVNASYDYLFRFTSRPAAFTNNPVSVIFMDNPSLEHFKQTRGKWDRALHAQLLNRLADDGCRLVLLDVFFRQTNDVSKDVQLANAMRRLSNVVLMAEQVEGQFQPAASAMGIETVQPIFPAALFMEAARSNSAVPLFDRPPNIVRTHWPFPSPSAQDSLPWLAARLAGADLDEEHPRERWLRYYDRHSAWASMSYVFALAPDLRRGYFRNHIVFIGNKPGTDWLDNETDKFFIPGADTRCVAVGGVEILSTAFLNLMGRDWLERPPRWIEAGVLVISGGLLGAGLRCCRRRRVTLLLSIFAAPLALVAAAALTRYTHYWFPWLIVAGAQTPLALVLAIASRKPETEIDPAPAPAKTALPATASAVTGDSHLDTPDYERVEPPFGKGAYGKVWLARNAVGQWQALKAIYRDKFDDAGPFEREWHGIERFKPVSRLHPGLLCVDFVSRIRGGYFYYVMELGDAVEPGWEQTPANYKPLDLGTFAARHANGHIPPRQCVSIARNLCEALQFLHSRNLTHRDVKPRNIIFVNGQPKLADAGLVANAQRPIADLTWVGTPGYMPPDPEPPGTIQADLYALGMVLYVISTGRKPQVFPELSATLVDQQRNPGFTPLSELIFKTCHPDRAIRYGSAAEMLVALKLLEEKLANTGTPGQNTIRVP